MYHRQTTGERRRGQRRYAIDMSNRRQFLTIVGASVVLTPVVAWLSRLRLAEPTAGAAARFPVEKTDVVWRTQLGPDPYYVLRKAGTERPFSSPLNHETRKGRFACVACDLPLFSSASKYDSGTGWPSFWEALDGAVGTAVDQGLFMVRTEVHCARCGGHLGHLFPDGPRPTGQRYCMNGVAMTFTPEV